MREIGPRTSSACLKKTTRYKSRPMAWVGVISTQIAQMEVRSMTVSDVTSASGTVSALWFWVTGGGVPRRIAIAFGDDWDRKAEMRFHSLEKF